MKEGPSCRVTPQGRPSPDKFYKRSQEKNTSAVAGVFLAVQPAPLSRIVLVFRSVFSGRCEISAASLVFSLSGVHRLFTTKPFRSWDQQAARLLGANHGSIGDSWPIAFSGCPRGTRVAWETSMPEASKA